VRLLMCFLPVALPGLACSCSSVTICSLIENPTLFVGEVASGGITSLRQNPWNTTVNHVRFKVLESFRGLPRGVQAVDIELHPWPGMCSPVPYVLGHKYLVAPSTHEGKLVDGPCFRGFDLERFPEMVRQVREFFAGKLPLNVQGRVYGAPFGLLPLSGVTIAASGGGKTHTAVTRADGAYFLPVSEAGTYELRATLEPYRTETATVPIGPRGCTVRDFVMGIDNSISGTVRDRKGRILKDAPVGLIELDHQPTSPREHAYFYLEYVGRNGLFKFDRVPIGRYLLGSNPDGPNSGAFIDGSYERTYYPLASSRANAQVIEIKHAGTHLTGMDLVTGETVPLRQVTVRVHFPDGAPMDTAMVYCTGLSREKDDPPWLFDIWTIAGKRGTLQFKAPSNRKLRLEVEDVYHRPLKADYSSTHEPGVAPVTQEFVIKP